jgi:Tfp pilus assembly protein PilO
MNTVTAQHHLRYGLERLGITGLIGLVLVIFSAYWWIYIIQTVKHDNQILLQRINQPDIEVKTQAQIKSGIKFDKEQQLEKFYSNFPNKKQIPDLLQAIYTSAQVQNLVLESGEYISSTVKTGVFTEYRITFPIVGQFNQILSFVNTTLDKNKNLSLDVASFKRAKVGDPQVEAKLIFTLFLKDSI